MTIQPLATSTPLLPTPCIGKLFITILRNQPSLPGPFHWEGVHANHPRLCRASSEIGSHPCWSQTKRISHLRCAYVSVHHSLIHAVHTQTIPFSSSVLPSPWSFYSTLSDQVITTDWSGMHLASLVSNPGCSHLQFLIACNMQKLQVIKNWRLEQPGNEASIWDNFSLN